MTAPSMLEWMDAARRSVGHSLDGMGLGPREMAYRVAMETPGARLRAYHGHDASGPVLIIAPAPFKRPYIWDLTPDVSVVRRCLARGFRVYLIEWLDPDAGQDGFGLFDYADRILLECVEASEAETGASAPILAGHSIGGTFAAIFAALFPQRVGGLILVDAPLAFGEHGGPLAHAVANFPHARVIRQLFGSPVPGALIDALCVAAAPEVFQLQRHGDLLFCLGDPPALTRHARMERWSYDEFPMAGQLFEDIIEQLYRNDLFAKGALAIKDRCARLADLSGRIVAVANPAGIIVPPRSLTEGLQIAQKAQVTLLEYGGGRGPMLQHLGPLVTPATGDRLWPRILDWAEGF